ncbi:sporulation protein [Actinoplanes sp. LDG1-06]|uniref:Sporulation protein n=1 Tax=Paractinoplanes ovalisporus TaxID=2810368 RepID=A0ABS2AUU6_9ACTN|nr:sporulation protein [Actinoplanes ovalisporus]MBM2623596.1 sporulation protein [Actinoplanes ovalisporus]
MVFKKMLGALGVGGLSVDTVLQNPNGIPGGAVAGRVELVGGSSEAAIEHITLSLVTGMEIESGRGERTATGEFHRMVVSGPARLGAGERRALPFQLVLPWETDKRGGMFGGGHDSHGHYTVAHTDADTVDWTQQVDGWVRQAIEQRQTMPGYGPGGYPQPGYGGPGYGQPGYGGHPGYPAHGSPGYPAHGGHGGRGPGMAGVAAGVVGGLAAGYLAGEIMDEVFEDDDAGDAEE